MNIFYSIIFIIFALQLPAQKHNKEIIKITKKEINFPASFIGDWKGELIWYPNGKASQKVNMEMHINKTDTANQYTWQIVYGSITKDNRPYILKQTDTIKTHWVIDELNGIILDSYWVGNRFTGVFAIMGNTILDSYWIENGEMHVEFFSYTQKPTRTSGTNTEESPTTESYRIGSYQKAVLKKISN